MKFIQQLDRADKISKAKQIVFENVEFTSGFAAFLDALKIDKLIGEDWSRFTNRDNTITWNDFRHREGVLLETDNNPMVYRSTRVVFSGSQSALLKVRSIMERMASYDGKPNIEAVEPVYQYHDSLNDLLWDGVDGSYALKPEVREKLMANAEAFFAFLKVEDLDVEDIVLTGSAANFNWNENSDVDLHIVVDMAKAEKKYGVLVKEYFDTKKRIWNDLHNIQIKGFPVEFYVEDNSEEHVSTGVYSIQNDEWVIEPKHEEPSVDDSAVRAKANAIIGEIQDVLSADKAEAVEKLMEKIRRMRQSGLSKSGEFSVENLAFKILRNDGWLEKMHDCKTKAFDRELSIEEEEWAHYC